MTRPCGFRLWVGLVLVFAAGAAPAQGRGRMQHLDVPYVATPAPAVAEMLRLARVGPHDVVYDLGSGDGRIVVAAVRDFGAKAGVGIDIDLQRVLQGQENARKAGVSDRTQFILGDAFKADFGEATVLTMFLTPRILRELEPRILAQLRPGSRVVSYRFRFDDWKPERAVETEGGQIFLWTVPERR